MDMCKYDWNYQYLFTLQLYLHVLEIRGCDWLKIFSVKPKIEFY